MTSFSKPTIAELEAILQSDDAHVVEIRPDGSVIARTGTDITLPWPDPTPEMLKDDPLFDAIWAVIKSWDVNVAGAYTGYMGATGNHVRAIYDAVCAVSSQQGNAP